MKSRTLNALLVVLALLVVSGCATVARPAGEADAVEPAEAWARVLARHVDDAGRVDFRGMAVDRADLDRYVRWVYDHSPESHPHLFPGREDVLAFHLNAYNALAMHSVIEAGFPPSLAGPTKVRFFWLNKIRVGGRELSLYYYENKVIRAFGEARIHFALNCMSVGCPALPRVPFNAAMLETQLQRETVKFMNDPKHVRVDVAARTAWLSEIFDFFPSDFLAVAPSLLDYVNRFRAQKVPADYSVRFISYDWTVNSQPSRQAEATGSRQEAAPR